MSLAEVGVNVMSGGLESPRRSLEPELDSQFYFWARQLIPFIGEKEVAFAGFENNQLKKLQLIEVVNYMKEIEFLEAVTAVNFLPQPSFIKVSFNNVNMVEIFRDTVLQINGTPIKVINSEFLKQSIFISIANLSTDQIISLLIPQLVYWGQIVKILPQFIYDKNGNKIQVGFTRIELRLKPEFSLDDIPYFIKVYGFKIYLNIRNRKRVCFRCNSPDHLVSVCSLKYCGICRGLRDPGHKCLRSFAGVVGGDTHAVLSSVMHDSILSDLDFDPQNLVDISPSAPAKEFGDLAKVEASSAEVSGSVNTGESKGQEKLAVGASGGLGKRMRTRSVSRSEWGVDNRLKLQFKKQIGKGSEPKALKLPGKNNPKKKNKRLPLIEKVSLDCGSEDSANEMDLVPEVCCDGREPATLSTSHFDLASGVSRQSETLDSHFVADSLTVENEVLPAVDSGSQVLCEKDSEPLSPA